MDTAHDHTGVTRVVCVGTCLPDVEWEPRCDMVIVQNDRAGYHDVIYAHTNPFVATSLHEAIVLRWRIKSGSA